MQYENMEKLVNINEALQQRAGPQTRSYTTVPLNQKFSQYKLRIYPTQETEAEFLRNKPWIYTIVVLSVILITSIVLFSLDRLLARRQRIITESWVISAEDTAAFEHELNEFIAHEVRK